MKKYLAPLLLLSALQTLEANVCVRPKNAKDVDLSPNFGPPRDQGGVGWCFANSAADQLDYYRFRKTKDHKYLEGENRISANYLATQYHQDIPWFESLGRTFVPNRLEENVEECQKLSDSKEKEACVASAQVGSYMDSGGRPNKVFEQTIENGYCTEAQIPSENFTMPNPAVVGDLAMNGWEYENILGVIFREKSELIPESADTCDKVSSLHAIAPAARVEDLQAILREYQGKDLIYNAYDLACPESARQKIAPPPTNVSDYISDLNLASIGTSQLQSWEEKNGEREKKVAEILDQGIPVGISVDLRFFQPRPTEEYVTANGLDPSSVWKDEGGLIKWGAINSLHAMTIVGKKFNPETCEYDYIVRNSWGNSCGPMIKEFRYIPVKAKSLVDSYKDCQKTAVKQEVLDSSWSELTSKKSAADVLSAISAVLPERNIDGLVMSKFDTRIDFFAEAPEDSQATRDEKSRFLESYRIEALQRLMEAKRTSQVIPKGRRSVLQFCDKKFPITSSLKAPGIKCDPSNGQVTVSAKKLRMSMVGIDYLK